MEEQDEKTPHSLPSTLLSLKTSSKCTYASWIQYFDEGERKESGLVVEALLLDWLSWFILPSRPEDEINSFVFPMAILLAIGERLALAPLCLGLLSARLASALTA